MSETFHVKSTEHGLVRLFAVDLPPEKIESFDVAEALGVKALDPAQVELFAVSDLTGLGLSGYLNEGLGIAREELDSARLDALTGCVLIVRSAAFQGQSVKLSPKAPLRWVGTYPEESAPVKFEPLPSAAALGDVPPPTSKKRSSDAAMSGRVAMIALLVIFALTALVVWLAG
jgi:hypothetical protein